MSFDIGNYFVRMMAASFFQTLIWAILLCTGVGIVIAVVHYFV